MILFAQIVGVLAVATLLLSYQQKKRKNIILWNITARTLYIIQYVVLGAFEGVALDIMGALSSVVAQKKDSNVIKKYLFLVIAVLNLLIVAVGLLLYKNIFSLFPIAGVIFQTSALWMSKEKYIRLVSFLGTPFWLVYNLSSLAYGSAIGDVLTLVSIGTAIYRFDIRRKKN